MIDYLHHKAVRYQFPDPLPLNATLARTFVIDDGYGNARGGRRSGRRVRGRRRQGVSGLEVGDELVLGESQLERARRLRAALHGDEYGHGDFDMDLYSEWEGLSDDGVGMDDDIRLSEEDGNRRRDRGGALDPSTSKSFLHFIAKAGDGFAPPAPAVGTASLRVKNASGAEEGTLSEISRGLHSMESASDET